MSKSLGNFFSVRDLLDQGYPGEVIRFVYLSTHYRKPMDWTAEKAVAAAVKLEGFLELVEKYGDLDAAADARPHHDVIDALADDLNTHAALNALNRMNGSDDTTNLARNLIFLGFFTHRQLVGKVEQLRAGPSMSDDIAERIDYFVEARNQARSAKEFARSDAIRDALLESGVVLRDTPGGTEWDLADDFDPAKLEALK